MTDCEFKEYNLDFSGQGHSFSHMTPFYSQGSQQSLSQGSMDDMSASQDAGGTTFTSFYNLPRLGSPLRPPFSSQGLVA